jgi:hypothetical protein
LLAVGYSRCQQMGEIEVIVTQCKFIRRGPKGAPGKVQVSQHRRLKVDFSQQAFQALRKFIPHP